MSKLSSLLGRKFLYTVEILPPRNPDIKILYDTIDRLKKFSSRITAVNVPDLPNAMLFMNSLVCAITLKQNDIEPIYQITCRDKNSLSIESDLLAASAFDIENVIATTGDYPLSDNSNYKLLKMVYELDSTSLIKTLVFMNEGRDIAGDTLNNKTNFYIGSEISVDARPLDPEVYKTKRKLNTGARFLQTRSVFEIDKINNFLNRYESLIGEDVNNRIIVGLPVVYKQIKLPIMPNHIKKRINESKEPLEEGVQITLENIDKIKDIDVGGINLISGGNIDIMERIIDQI